MRIINRKKGEQFKISNEILATVIDTDWHGSVLVVRCPKARKLFFNNGEGVTPRQIPTYKPFTLRKGESVWVDDEIAIVMCVTSPSYSSIGVDAPDHISLSVEEVYDHHHPKHRHSVAS